MKKHSLQKLWTLSRGFRELSETISTLEETRNSNKKDNSFRAGSSRMSTGLVWKAQIDKKKMIVEKIADRDSVKQTVCE